MHRLVARGRAIDDREATRQQRRATEADRGSRVGPTMKEGRIGDGHSPIDEVGRIGTEEPEYAAHRRVSLDPRGDVSHVRLTDQVGFVGIPRQPLG